MNQERAHLNPSLTTTTMAINSREKSPPLAYIASHGYHYPVVHLYIPPITIQFPPLSSWLLSKLHVVELNSSSKTSFFPVHELIRLIFNVDDLLLLLFHVPGIKIAIVKLSTPLASLICVLCESLAQFVEMLEIDELILVI